ncbi:hypothetical protein Metvu_1753 (plasmid) [Methanocaldococcus vulcanius M7]|uniref:Uncharacterized protein n=1 Tax=Methanocaldococcus vulcanius (strain ATCC 700851 / DSM 12094 / M7) TaxID=579137 RepID=C9RIG6_METVM|nr:hypothetical protein Metvu_1753 [Methanocaldococcus vulcanius M7]
MLNQGKERRKDKNTYPLLNESVKYLTEQLRGRGPQ